MNPNPNSMFTLDRPKVKAMKMFADQYSSSSLHDYVPELEGEMLEQWNRMQASFDEFHGFLKLVHGAKINPVVIPDHHKPICSLTFTLMLHIMGRMPFKQAQGLVNILLDIEKQFI